MTNLIDRVRALRPLSAYEGGLETLAADEATIREAADALAAAEIALGGAWYFIAAFDKDNAPNLLAEIKAALAKMDGAA
jgi:hypothetical protein